MWCRQFPCARRSAQYLRSRCSISRTSRDSEIVIVETQEVKLERPVRFLHPRWPLYIVPRENGRFLIGATVTGQRIGERLDE